MKGVFGTMSVSPIAEKVKQDENDFETWLRSISETNSEQIERAIRMLGVAIQEDLSPTQQLYLQKRFFENKGVRDIAAECGVNPSTVSRTIRRAERRLYKVCKYIIG